jgi:hypothetical protein
MQALVEVQATEPRLGPGTVAAPAGTGAWVAVQDVPYPVITKGWSLPDESV